MQPMQANLSVYVIIYDSHGRMAMHKLTRAARLSQSEKTYPLGSSGIPNGAVFSTAIACGPGSAVPTVPSAIISLAWGMYMYAVIIHDVTVTVHPV